MNQITAKLNNLRIAPRKVRLIASPLRGLTINEAEAQLLFRPQRSSKPLLQLLRSAVANAKNNQNLDPNRLVIAKVLVNQGPMLKRFLPRAMGRATPIHKKTSHIILVLGERANLAAPRFQIVRPIKAVKKPSSKTKVMKSKLEVKKEIAKKTEKAGFFKRLFSRKSI